MAKSLKNWAGVTAVIGVDWGDSGKGRLIDDLSQRAKIIARYAGGSNTGHTVQNNFGKFALHIMPSGIFNKKAICLVGRNVALDLESLYEEMQSLDEKNVSYKNLILDEQATLTMPWHKKRDGIREKLRKGKKVGTTGKGVGPTYADRAERVGLLLKDIKSSDFKTKLQEELKIQNKFYNLKLSAKKIAKDYEKIVKKIKPYVGKTVPILNEHIKKGENVLFEGAQGYFLDIDAGTYPFVTSSNPGVVGIARSFDIHPSEINEVIGITKAYTTRVGEGPMPTKIEGSISKHIIEEGNEVGTTTGRVRSPGWLDLTLIKYAARANKITTIAITKLDVLSKLKKIKICTDYQKQNKPVGYLGHDSSFLEKVEPKFEVLDGWEEDISKIRSFAKLPKNAKIYIETIEKHLKIPVRFISVGPNRGEVIFR